MVLQFRRNLPTGVVRVRQEYLHSRHIVRVYNLIECLFLICYNQTLLENSPRVYNN